MYLQIFLKKSSFCQNQEPSLGVRHCTPNYGYRTDLITEILSSPYPLRFRSICFKSIPCPLRLRTKVLKTTRNHCVYATMFSVFSVPTCTKKTDFYLYPYSVANGNQDLKVFFRHIFVSSGDDFLKFILQGPGLINA